LLGVKLLDLGDPFLASIATPEHGRFTQG